MTFLTLNLEAVASDPIFGCLPKILTENVPSYYTTTLEDCTFQLLLKKNNQNHCYLLTNTKKLKSDLELFTDLNDLTFSVTNIYNLYYNIMPTKEDILKLIPNNILQKCQVSLFLHFLTVANTENVDLENLTFNSETLRFVEQKIIVNLDNYDDFRQTCKFGLEIETWQTKDNDRNIPKKIIEVNENYKYCVDGSTDGWEFQTDRPMNYNEINNFGKHILNQCVVNKLEINEKCSMHISISHPALKMVNHTSKKVKNLQAICTALSIPLLYSMIEQRFANKENFDRYYKIRVHGEKYTSVSFRKKDNAQYGYFEFRFIGGNLTVAQLEEAFNTVAYTLWAAVKLLDNKKEYAEIVAESHGLVKFLEHSLLLPDIGMQFSAKTLIKNVTTPFIERVKQICVQ